jgi:hypothetical protein
MERAGSYAVCAQTEAVLAALTTDDQLVETKEKDSTLTRSWTSESFLGMWMDSWGNAVVVSADAFKLQLRATVSSPPRPDLHLSLRPALSGWQCGHSMLDPAQSSATQVCWIGSEGQISIWTRPRDCKHSSAPTLRPLGDMESVVGRCGPHGVSQLLIWQPFPRN